MSAPASRELPVFLDLTKVRSAANDVVTTSSGGIPFWGDDSASWDTVYLAGMRLPGIAKVKGRCRRGHDRKRATGKHGATFTFTGDEPMEFDISLKLWTGEHLGDFTRVAKHLKSLKPMETTTKNVSKTVKEPKKYDVDLGNKETIKLEFFEKKTVTTQVKEVRVNPVSVIHPALAIYGVSQVFVLEFGLPEESGSEGSGIFTVSLHCVEYIPEQIRQNGGTTTPTTPGDTKISNIGETAIKERPKSPAATNTGPGL